MRVRNTASSYGSAAKFFHWLIFLLLFCMITFGFFLDDVPKEWQSLAYNTHKLIGLTILVLMILRALWAFINIKPTLPVDTLPWQRFAERVVHLGLYVVVIAMPIAGWVGSLAAGHPPHLGSLNIEFPMEKNKALSDTAFDMHELLAFTIIVLFCIHVSAAIYHHIIKKDDVLRRMMPKC